LATQAKSRERSDKRARILDAAVKVFAERGFFTATVAEIARAAKVADGTIYLYFKSKEDLLVRLFEDKMSRLLEEARGALAREEDAAARLRRFIQLHFALVEKNPDLAAVLIVELRQSELVKGLPKAKLAAYLDLIAEVVGEGQQAGQFVREASPATVKRAVFGALDELALAWLLSGRKTPLKKAANEVATLFVRGLSAHPQKNGVSS
jgi:TetR/AcrR family fatty acid metabolism transcriptional regulator